MRFQVPQYIETEDKIIGPLTLRQFLYLAGAGAVSFVLYFILTFFFWIVLTVFAGAVAIALAFVKINGQPFIKILGAAVRFMSKPRLYLWKRKLPEKIIDVPELPAPSASEKPEGKLEKLRGRLTTETRAVPKREKPLFRGFRLPTANATPAQEEPAAAPQKAAPAPESEEEFLEIETPAGSMQKAKRIDYTE